MFYENAHKKNDLLFFVQGSIEKGVAFSAL